MTKTSPPRHTTEWSPTVRPPAGWPPAHPRSPPLSGTVRRAPLAPGTARRAPPAHLAPGTVRRAPLAPRAPGPAPRAPGPAHRAPVAQLASGPPRRAPVAAAVSLALAVSVLAGGCSTFEVAPLPDPIRPPILPADVADALSVTVDEGHGTLVMTRAPGVPGGPGMAEGAVDSLGEDLVGEPIAVAFNNVPLAAFIDELFNERLGLSFHISPSLSEKVDLVTLRIADPLPPSQLFATARRVLESYGVLIRGEEDGTVTFVASDDISSREIPLLISGRARPEVPATHRTIFQLVSLKVMRPNQIASLLAELIRGLDLVVHEKPERGGVLLQGKLETVDAAVAMIEVLDQPLLIGRHGLVVEPAFLLVDDMARDLISILGAQGYEAEIGRSDIGAGVILLPLQTVNKLVVFAADPAVLERVKEWARVLDVEREAAVEDGWFTYEIRNTLASRLTGTLDRIMGIDSTGSADAEGRGSAAETRANQRLFVDEDRNLVFFKGAGKEWAKIRAMLKRLDKPVPSVLIEVLLAEVTLSGREESGIEYLAKLGIGGRDVDARLASGGLTLTLDGAGETRALLRLAFEDSRVVIRSRPRLVVQSGAQARLFGGTDIPILSQRAEGTQVEGSTSIVQQIEYRKTGVNLQITPIVQANGLVDLTVSQQLSEARAAGAVTLTPTILTREVNTSMTLRDGQSVLIGGLISESQSQGRSGVPGLGKLPFLGRLFRADSYQKDRTELLVMVIPYVIADPRQARELTEQIKAQLELHRRFL